MTTINDTKFTISTVAAEFLAAGRHRENAMQHACVTIMQILNTTGLINAANKRVEFDPAALVRGDGEECDKTINRSSREALDNMVKIALRGKEYKANANKDSDKGLRDIDSLKSAQAEFRVALKNAAALLVLGVNVADFQIPTVGHLRGSKASSVFHVPAKAIVFFDEEGNEYSAVNGSLFPVLGDMLPLNGQPMTWTAPDGKTRRGFKLSMTGKGANLARMAKNSLGIKPDARTKDERELDAIAQSIKALQAKTAGIVAMAHQLDQTFAKGSGQPGKVLLADPEANAAAVHLVVNLLMAFGGLTMHEKGDGVPTVIAPRILNMYNAARDQNPVDVTKH